MENFSTISPLKLNGNAFEMIGKEWMLITGGTKNSFNTMTASWGGFGELWFKPVVFIFIRPQRHTLEFINNNDFFTLSFFGKEKREELTFCGRNSGKDVDKFAHCDFLPFETENKAIGIQEATTILECKKLYVDTIKENCFINTDDLKHYPNKDFHLMYVAEVKNVYVRQ